MDYSCKLGFKDGQVRPYCTGSVNPMSFNEVSPQRFLDQKLVNGARIDGKFIDTARVDRPVMPPDPNSSGFTPFYGVQHTADLHEDFDFSDVVLGYINQMLMEEDMEEKTCMFQESAALLAAEKSFYEVLGEKYPPPHEEQPVAYSDQSSESLDENHVEAYNSDGGNNHLINSLLRPGWICDSSDYSLCNSQGGSVRLVAETSQSIGSLTSNGSPVDGLADSPVSTLGVTDIFTDSQSALLMKKGYEEASKFLPSGNNFFADMGTNELLANGQKKKDETVLVKLEDKHQNEKSHNGSRSRKNPYTEEDGLDESRSNKHSALFCESTVRSEMFDMVLLCSEGKYDSALRESLMNDAKKSVQQNNQPKGSNSGKARGKKQGGKKDVVDLRTLLTLCAQAVAANDQRNASDLLKQIRQHSSPSGDGMQRLAHYFSNGLEARMAGSGTQIYKQLIAFPLTAADVLKAYHLLLATSPFRKIPNFFANKTIIKVAENATRLHIVDFGILYGFQWPCLIQRLSTRPGGPPKLKITGIDFPNPGFRPSRRVEETGQRLTNYAETFGVPFEFHAIAQKWDTIKIEDIDIDRDEMLVVNCLFRFKNLLDETVVVDSPRNKVMNLIRKMKPDIYIQGVTNGSYNAPFFITRFREALFHFSSLFDMLEANVPRETHERMLLEKMIFGQEAMNVIACEGAERIDRPETYKQWQVRNLRAGFRQLPLDKEIMRMAKDRVKSCYHKDFIIDEDGQWMLQGWKGRILFALSSWKPAY
ncbi:hypothetical protein ACET3Z_029211 [Daucus carota]